MTKKIDTTEMTKRFDLNFYVVTSTETLAPVASDDPVEATATCNEGDQVTGGGFEVRDIGLFDTARPTLKVT